MSDFLLSIYGLFGKWLVSGELKITEGEISLLGQDVVMLPSTFVIELHKSILKSKNTLLRDELYMWGWRTSYLYIKRFVEAYKLSKFEERYRWGMDIAVTAGLGDYKTLDYKRGEYSHFYTVGSPVAKALYPAKNPVDILLRGINGGGGTATHLKITNCLEVECQAVNGKRCVFVTATEKAHKKMGVSHLYKSQLNLKKIKKQQDAFLKKVGLPKVKGIS